MLEEVQATIVPLMDKNHNTLELEIADDLPVSEAELELLEAHMSDII